MYVCAISLFLVLCVPLKCVLERMCFSVDHHTVSFMLSGFCDFIIYQFCVTLHVIASATDGNENALAAGVDKRFELQGFSLCVVLFPPATKHTSIP